MRKSLLFVLLLSLAAFGQNRPPVPSISGQFNQFNEDIQEEFCGNTPATTTTVGQYGWDITVIVTGTNPVAAVASVANHPCLITLTTDTTATNGVGISLGHGVGVLFPGNSTNWQSEHIAEINQVATGSYRIGFGTVDSATAIPTNGIYFRFLNGTDTFINACSDTTSTETCTPTTVAPTAGDYVDFFMNSSVTGNVVFTVIDKTNSGAIDSHPLSFRLHSGGNFANGGAFPDVQHCRNRLIRSRHPDRRLFRLPTNCGEVDCK